MASINDDVVINIINRKHEQNQTLDKIATYILSCDSLINQKDASEIAKILYFDEGLNFEQVKSPENSKIVNNYIVSFILRKASVLSEEEVQKTVPLITVKKQAQKKFVLRSIITLLVAAGVVVGGITIKNNIDDRMTQKHVSESLAKIVCNIDETEYNNNTIIGRNDIELMGKNGTHMYGYNHHGMARDIIKICENYPELFSICINNVYYGIDQNRLENMDKLLTCLSIGMDSNEKLQDVYKRIENCNYFLDYVLSEGFADPNASDYYDLLEAIENYKKVERDNPEFSNAFYKLSQKDQELIKKLMKRYEDNRFNLFNEYASSLDDAVNGKNNELDGEKDEPRLY